MDLQLIRLSEELQEHFNKQITDRGLPLSAADPTVSATIASGSSSIAVDDITIWSSDIDGWDPDLEGLISAYETQVMTMLKHVRPATKQQPIFKEVIAALIDMCHCSREALTKRSAKEYPQQDFWNDLNRYTEQAEALIKKAKSV